MKNVNTAKRIALFACGVAFLGCGAREKPAAPVVVAEEPKTLAEAILDDRPGAVRKILASGAKVNEANDKGETPLHLAAESSRLNIGRILVEAGADVNAKTKNGETPLAYSISMGRGGLVLFLIKHGASVNASSKGEWTPLHWALGTQDEGLINGILDAGADPNGKDMGLPYIFTAVEYGTLKNVQSLVAHGASPNAKSAHDGSTPIFAAVWKGTGMVDGLLQLGADINARNFSGQTVLDYALAHRHDPYIDQTYPRFQATIKLLQSRGANTSKTKIDNSGMS